MKYILGNMLYILLRGLELKELTFTGTRIWYSSPSKLKELETMRKQESHAPQNLVVLLNPYHL